MGIITVSRLLNPNEWVQWVERILISRERGTGSPAPGKSSSDATYWKDRGTLSLILKIGSIMGYVQGGGSIALRKTPPPTSSLYPLPLTPGKGLVETEQKSNGWSGRAITKVALVRSVFS